MTVGRLAAACLLLVLAPSGLPARAQETVAVSQKNRAFAPKQVTIDRGGSVRFVNDDGELLHHVHSKDPRFPFDIGEQPAGSEVPVRFEEPGTFDVRCDIHPRMLLKVTVR